MYYTYIYIYIYIAEVKKLTTSIDQMAAKSATLKEEVAELQASRSQDFLNYARPTPV